MKFRKVAISFIVATALGLTGCVDSDGDGLSNTQERRLGTDPELADTDGDGVLDGEEVDVHGTDPLAADTDGDGYSDGDEIAEGVDPTDEDEGIFQGGFPFNSQLDDEDCDDEFSGSADVGDELPCGTFVNQYDEDYNLWHTKGAADWLVIDTGAVWCGPCNAIAEWLDGGDAYFGSDMDPAREAVWNGDAIWITALFEDGGGQPADLGDAEAWAEEFPTEGVPVIVDDERDLIDWVGPPGIPSLSLVNLETMEVEIVDDTGGVAAFLRDEYGD